MSQPPNLSPTSHRRPLSGATALLRSPRFLGHDTGSHPENPRRIAAIDQELARAGLLTDRPDLAFDPASIEQVERIHDSRYVTGVHELAAAGGGWLDGDTPVMPDSVEVALLAAGAAVAGVDAVLDGAVQRAFALGRPPGHHATVGRGMGFCLFNSVAIAAAHALSRGLARVAILDWDVHHGNGTQDIFYESDQVLFCSVHQSPLYPGTGAAAERGAGRGEGFTLNAPLAAGQDDAAIHQVFDELLLPAARAFQPDLVLISAGFDAHAADPLGGMRLTEAGFAGLATRVAALADESAAGRLVLVLEGGYDLGALGRSVADVVRALDDAPAGPASDAAVRGEMVTRR